MNKSIYERWYELLEADISNSSSIIANYYISNNTPTRLYLGVSLEGQFLDVEFDKHILDNISLPSLKGVDISVIKEPTIDPSKDYVRISNLTNNQELFMAFSSSLYDNLIMTNDYHSAFHALNTTIKEFREFFADKHSRLSKEEEEGLCAELLELKELITIKGEDVVNSWTGPTKNKRDFVFDKNALEIKATLGQLDPNVLISNENQLDCNFPKNLSNLFLKVYVFEEVTNGIDVISCAQDVNNLLANLQNKGVFMANLCKVKVDINDYKPKYKFTVQTTTQYKITKDFPKITSSDLPEGVFGVKYHLHLNSLNSFVIKEEDMNEQL